MVKKTILDEYTKCANHFESLKDLEPKTESASQIERDLGITFPKNEFFTIIGHDDAYDSNYLEVMNNLIINHPNASLYQAHFRFIDFNGEFKRSCLPMANNQFSFEFLACQFKRTLDSMGTGYMMRTKDFEKVGIDAGFHAWVKQGHTYTIE